MSNIGKLVDAWNVTINEEWVIDIAPQRLPYLKNKLLYSMYQSASKSFLYYLENPATRESALANALAYREGADFWSDESTDYDKIATSICDKIIGIEDESAIPERPDWISEEEWVEARYEATHDADNKMYRPRIEGFITGAHYDTPCVYPSEFDVENARRVVRAAMQSVLFKATADSKLCNMKLTKSMSRRAKIFWQQESFDAKQVLESTKAFIKQHNLEWDE